jgi:hypothetical protein
MNRQKHSRDADGVIDGHLQEMFMSRDKHREHAGPCDVSQVKAAWPFSTDTHNTLTSLKPGPLSGKY